MKDSLCPTKTSHQGFTLMEVLVATGIFVVMVLAVFGIFSSVLQGQKNSLAQAHLERDAQLVLETLVKKIRTSRVDYAEYEALNGLPNPVPNSTSTLILIDQNDTRFRIQHNANTQAIDLEFGGGLPSPITSNDVAVTALTFMVEPTADPFTNVEPVTQPRVTVVLEMVTNESNQPIQLILQQTVPQRGGNY